MKKQPKHRTHNFWPLLTWLVIYLAFIVVLTILWPSDKVWCEWDGGVWMEDSWCKRWFWDQ